MTERDRTMKQNEIVELGWANGWGQKKPKEYKDCCDKNHYHEWQVQKLGRSIEKMTCHQCKISWSVDSSD